MTQEQEQGGRLRLVAYLRVSTDRQAERGLGLPVQRRAISEWARAGGHKIVAWHTDAGVSGSNGLDDRPGLSAAFADLAGGIGKLDGIVVYRLDRLARKLALQITWTEQVEAAGQRVISVTEPDVGEDEMRVLVRQIMGAIAEYERAVIKRRMQSGRAEKARAGGYAFGSPAFGLRSEAGALVPDLAEQASVEIIRELSAGGMSARGIAAELNRRGVLSKRGGQWSHKTVARVLARL